MIKLNNDNIEEIINYIEKILDDVCLNEEDYVDALYKVLNDLRNIKGDVHGKRN